MRAATPMVLFCLALSSSLAYSMSLGAQQGKTKTAEPANRDPYFTATASRSTTHMPRVIIRNIREDRAGNIWFATFGGPIRYDGKVFTNFAEEVGLAKTRVFSLTEDRSGALWFGSIAGGASRYDGKSFTKFTDKQGLADNDVTWIFEDRDANIWFGTGNGVSRYDGKSMINFTTKDGLVHNSVYAIGQDASGRIWFGTQGGICSYDGKSFSNLADQVGKSFVNIRAMVVDRSGKLWFGGQEGAFRYDGKTLTAFTSKEGLLDDFVGSMIVDRAGNLWLGHPGRFPDGRGGGASRYDGKSFKHYTQKDGLGSKTVYCMLEDKAGNIWFGSADAGACRYDGKTFTHFSAADPPLSAAKPAQELVSEQKALVAKGEIVSEMPKDLWRVFQAKDGRHWFASRTQGAFRYDGKTITRFTKKDGLSGDDVGGVQEDKWRNLYFSTNGGISKFDGRSFTTLKPVPSTEWKKEPDDLWFGGGQDSSVVYRYDGRSLDRLAFPKTKAGDDATLPRDKFPNAKYSPYDVYTIFKDSKGNVWFGTAVLGACRYDGKSFAWIPEEELRNGSFGTRSIIEYKDGKFWFSNTLYRYAVDLPPDASQWYRKEKGIGDLSGHKQGNYDYFMSSVLGDDGAMWMAILGGEVWRYDGKSMTRYPVTEDGKHHWIFSIYKDRQGVLWLGTQAHGAYRFNGKSFEKFRP
jgi:ligand-binding sensor domain-containing protein